MARRPKVKLYHPGMREVAQSADMHRLVQDAAEKVAGIINSENWTAKSPGSESEAKLHAEVEVTTTDRARARVVVKHPAAIAFQARYGIFTMAAAKAGLPIGRDTDLVEYVTKSGKKRMATKAQVAAWTSSSRR